MLCWSYVAVCYPIGGSHFGLLSWSIPSEFGFRGEFLVMGKIAAELDCFGCRSNLVFVFESWFPFGKVTVFPRRKGFRFFPGEKVFVFSRRKGFRFSPARRSCGGEDSRCVLF